MIPYGRQSISEDDIQAVEDVLRSDFLTQGPAVPAFESAVSKYCGSQHAIAVNSATSALHIACLALGLGSGDKLWTSPNTFVASANCALYCGAAVDFVDIDPKTYNMCADALEAKLEIAEREKALPKIVIPVHFAGQSCDMKAIHRLSKKYGFNIIEDASHAIGGEYCNEKIGNCRYSDITIFSFHPVKIITTGEGGLATTNDSQLAEQMRLLRSHGVTREQDSTVEKLEEKWIYQQIRLGFNYRMTDIQAALGISQLSRINEFIKTRFEILKVYDAKLSSLPIIKPWQHPDASSSLHLYPIQLLQDKCTGSFDRSVVFNHLRDAGIGVNVHYIPVHTQPFYKKMGFKAGDYPIAEGYYENAISLPIHPSLTHKQQEEVILQLTKVLNK